MEDWFLFPSLFVFQLFQMSIVNVISFGHVFLIPTVVAAFIPAN